MNVRRPLVVVLTGLFAFVSMGQESCGETTGSDGPSVNKGSKKDGKGNSQRKPAAPDAAVGDTLTLKGTAYTVEKATTAAGLGGQYTRVKADGRFVIVTLTLTNRKDEPATIVEDNVRLVGGNGKQYTTDTDALGQFENGFFALQEIQPDVSKKVVAVYDVPKPAVDGAALRVSDLFSDATGTIALGL